MNPSPVSAPRQPLQNILWLIGERVVRAAATATVLALVARQLAPAGFGQLNFAIAVVAVGVSLANLGLEGIVVSELIRRPDRTGAVLGTAVRLRLAASLVTVGVLVLGAVLTRGLHHEARLVAVVALGFVFHPVEVVDLWFQRHLDSRRTAVARLVAVLAGATLKLWLVARGAPLIAFAWAQVADNALFACALSCAGWRSPHPAGRWVWDADIARGFWRRGAPIAVAGVCFAFSLRVDQLLVRAWLGESAAGIYFAAARLTEIVLFTGATMTLSLFPALAAAHSRSEPEYQARLQAMFDALSALGWAVALGFTLAGPWIIRLLYGPAYALAAPVLAVQGWTCLFALNGAVRGQFILLSAPVLLNVAAAVVNIGALLALSWGLIPAWGTTGAALAALGAGIASNYASSFLFPALRRCAGTQSRGLLIPLAPQRWKSLVQQFHA